MSPLGAYGDCLLPSDNAAASLIRGEPGGWPDFLVAWAVRSLIIAPFLALAGVPGGKLVKTAAICSAGMSVYTLFWLKCNGCIGGNAP